MFNEEIHNNKNQKNIMKKMGPEWQVVGPDNQSLTVLLLIISSPSATRGNHVKKIETKKNKKRKKS